MAAGLGVLKLSPRHFWSMTPREFAAAVAPETARRQLEAPPPRSALDDLMQRYPDEERR